jgi:hypothetical protein
MMHAARCTLHAARCKLQTANCKLQTIANRSTSTGLLRTSLFQYSIIPLFQYSSIPVFQYSSIPVFQYWWLKEAWVFQMLAYLSLSLPRQNKQIFTISYLTLSSAIHTVYIGTAY